MKSQNCSLRTVSVCLQQTDGLCPLSPDLSARFCRAAHFIDVQSAQTLINGQLLKVISAFSVGRWNTPVPAAAMLICCAHNSAVPVHIYIVWLYSNPRMTALFSLPDMNLHWFVLFIMFSSSHWREIKCSSGRKENTASLIWTLSGTCHGGEPEDVTEVTEV